eukprot:10688757-Alexandrium_andersonii.AAC.1
MPVEPGMLPAVSAAWHRYAVLAAVAARYVLAGRADAQGDVQGTPLRQCASDHGRSLSLRPQARMRTLEGEQARHIDSLLAELPIEQPEAGGQDAAQLLVVYVQKQPEPRASAV